MTSESATPDSTVDLSRRIVRELFGPPASRHFAVRYWDGSAEKGATDQPAFTLLLRHPWTLRRLLLPPTERGMGEAFVDDDFDVEGDLEQTMALAGAVTGAMRAPWRLARLAALVVRLPTAPPRAKASSTRSKARWPRWRHSRASDAVSVRAHYDRGNDFYRLWLDTRMVYSCAYFPTGAEILDEAQEAKLTHICRKLRLQRGDTLLDIGCGWGGLVQFAAERYGVQVTGITLSAEQASLGSLHLQEAGLADRARLLVCDYRNLPREMVFDKVVSVGMLEHVGKRLLERYFRLALRHCRPGGVFLAHGIVDQNEPRLAGRVEKAVLQALGEESFVERYVFPDGELPTSWQLTRAATRAGWELRDLENLREHYAATLRCWVRRLEAEHERAANLAGEATYRVWRLYMSGAAHGFTTGDLGVVQLLLSRNQHDGSSAMPRSRAYMYD